MVNENNYLGANATVVAYAAADARTPAYDLRRKLPTRAARKQHTGCTVVLAEAHPPRRA